MAIFGRKTDDTKQAPAPATKRVSKQSSKGEPALSVERDLSSVLVRPRITEKAVGKSDEGVYTFTVRRDATKHDVRDAVAALFKVTPRKIAIVNKQPRPYVSRMRGRRGVHPGEKKAYVYLKKGDRIDLV